MLLSDASFERVVLPFKQNLERIGIDMSVRTVDTAQFKRREDEFDFDMMVEGFGQSLSPGNEQRDFWGSKAAGTPGSRNTIGIKDPAIDNADRDADRRARPREPDQRARARSTACCCGATSWCRSWHSNTACVAYWNRFARPAKAAKYAPVAFDTWWIDEAKDKALQRRDERQVMTDRRSRLPRTRQPDAHARLHPAPPDADDPDAARHHGDQLLHHPGGARRAGRADAGPDAGHGGQRHRALLRQRERRRDRAVEPTSGGGERRLSRRARPARN